MRRVAYISVVCVAIVIGYVFFTPPAPPAGGLSEAPPLPPAGVEVRHRNEVNHFSFQIPPGYSALEYNVAEHNQGAVVVQNQAGRGALILTTPFLEAELVLTQERIKKDVPTLSVRNARPITIANEVTGLAFDSDDAVWDGDAREVWFVHRHTLFQLSALRTDTEALDAVIATWRFDPVK